MDYYLKQMNPSMLLNKVGFMRKFIIVFGVQPFYLLQSGTSPVHLSKVIFAVCKCLTVNECQLSKV